MSRMLYIFFVFVSVIAAGLASKARQLPCLGDAEATPCEVSNLDITPCKNENECKFKIGRNASISFSFTPQFSASELEHDVSTTVLGRVESFRNLDTDACRFTGCPVSAGHTHTFTYSLYLDRTTVAKGKYTIKWLLWNKAQREQRCCFRTKINLVN